MGHGYLGWTISVADYRTYMSHCWDSVSTDLETNLEYAKTHSALDFVDSNSFLYAHQTLARRNGRCRFYPAYVDNL